MNACIIAINSGHERAMGFATYQDNGGINLKTSNHPVIKDKNVLVGVTGSERMLTELHLSPLILSMDIDCYQAMDVIRNTFSKTYAGNPEALVLALNNFLYHWHGGTVDLYGEFDENYLAVGMGREVAMGAIYGLRSSRYTVHEQVEMAIKAVTRFYPQLGTSTGVLNL